MNCLLFTLTFLVLVVAPAVSLKCYTCIGSEDNCKKSKLEDNKPTYLNTCFLADTCLRYWQKTKDNDAIVHSGCTTEDYCDAQKSACDKAKDTLKDYQCAVGCCSDDGCNAGSSLTFSIILLAMCTFLGLELLK
ncbi:uncharacterized protein LOC111345489 isoform X2 [Stylophora pistillata]|uniref:UPAR/Ly6 domain-containing protein n=1 Tax=Stylophora pistillata TaxID=50429 RepID=A0A2B4RAP1_STYPI|nr:uncharacterized protein LOC111345489 isoform X2 [Stylophora pistillata]PFX13879.1 hypothetical protein AWC38_SpisGene22008 [Stylophora pistillata]